VAYHYRCLSGDFAEPCKEAAPKACQAMVELFGHASDDEGRAGALVFSSGWTDTVKTHGRGGLPEGALLYSVTSLGLFELLRSAWKR